MTFGARVLLAGPLLVSGCGGAIPGQDVRFDPTPMPVVRAMLVLAGSAAYMSPARCYGFVHLLNRVWLAVHRTGLEPSLGLLHTGRRRSAGLVFDLMEPFRQPLVDRTVLALIGRRARLELGGDGDLTLRSRTLLHDALARRLAGQRLPAAQRLCRQIQHGVTAFRRALVNDVPYEAHRMSW